MSTTALTAEQQDIAKTRAQAAMDRYKGLTALSIDEVQERLTTMREEAKSEGREDRELDLQLAQSRADKLKEWGAKEIPLNRYDVDLAHHVAVLHETERWENPSIEGEREYIRIHYTNDEEKAKDLAKLDALEAAGATHIKLRDKETGRLDYNYAAIDKQYRELQAEKQEAADSKQLDDVARVAAEKEAAYRAAKEPVAETHAMQAASKAIGPLTKAEHDAGLAHALESSDLGLTPRDAIIPPPRLDDRIMVQAINKDAIREEIRDAKAAGKTSCVVQGSDLEIRREFMKEAYRQGMKVHTPDAATREELRKAVVSVEKERAAERLPEQSPSNDGPEYGR
ncbi:MAG: hypothetical protein ACYC8W_07785 [Candidatus Tyrphobacter sp.]